MSRERSNIDWAAVDWGKQDIELAEELGVCRERVRQVRQGLIDDVLFRHFKAEFKPDEEMTKEKRKRLLSLLREEGEGARIKKYQAETSRRRRESIYVELEALPTEKMTLPEIAHQMGYTEGHVRNALKRMKRKWKHSDKRRMGKYDWDSITKSQWHRLTDKEIAKLLRIKNPAVVTLHRIRNSIYKRPRWSLKKELAS